MQQAEPCSSTTVSLFFCTHHFLKRVQKNKPSLRSATRYCNRHIYVSFRVAGSLQHVDRKALMLFLLLHASPAYLPGVLNRLVERGMHRRFSWDTLNVTNATTCGGDKCYFQGEHEDEGWLVGGRSYLIQQSQGWAFAEELRAQFGVNHLLGGPPFLATLQRQQAKYLNAKLNQSLDRSKRPLWRITGTKSKNGAKQHYSAGPHPVQAVRSCSWPKCMVLKCSGNDPNRLRRLGPNNLTAQAIEGFVASATNKTNLSMGIQHDFAMVIAMIEAHPCLKSDFQVYLRNDGNVLNIDLDRCKRNKFGSVSLSDTEKRRLARRNITLTTEPLRLNCRDA